MCPPEHFDVVYQINPWMRADVPVERALAVRQWERLVETYQGLGHRVDQLPPVTGLPDMVFAANGSTVVGGRVLTAQFATDERAAEAEHHRGWHEANAAALGWRHIATPSHVNEAEGDFAVAGNIVLAGYGFRTDSRAHAELAEVIGMPVVSLRLVDPRFYHLDVALTVLDDTPGQAEIAWYPRAFSTSSQSIVRRLFPDAIEVAERDALVLGLNAVSDGRHVVLPREADGFATQVRERGYEPIGIHLGELLKGGGSVKCCTQELRAAA
jgi:N-dimethylarginine dimethylaminohydrolase